MKMFLLMLKLNYLLVNTRFKPTERMSQQLLEFTQSWYTIKLTIYTLYSFYLLVWRLSSKAPVFI